MTSNTPRSPLRGLSENHPMNEHRDDILISRVIDGDATTGEWDELTALAAADPSVWRNLALSLREDKALIRAVNIDVAVADAIELREPGRHPAVRARLGGWSGWVIAAMLGIAVVTRMLSPAPTESGLEAVSNRAQFLSASDLLQAYLDQGRQEDLVIAEVPERVLIETRPVEAGGGYELIYLRQILERTVVPDLYRFYGQDEMGRPTLVRYDGGSGPSM